jgi:integrase
MRGHIRRRGDGDSWELKIHLGYAANGRRLTRYESVRGTRRQAEQRLVELLAAAHDGSLTQPSKTTVAQYLRQWLENVHGLSGRTKERYAQLVEAQIIPHIGGIALQKLKPVHIAEWHSTLLREGGANKSPLSARTTGHAHRALHVALSHATKSELITRNVASIITPPKVEDREIDSLKADEIGTVLAALQGHPLQAIGILALSTGARRGELLALAWGCIDLDKGSMKIERSLEQTRSGVTFKAPKTKTSRRTISLPPMAIEVLRAHRLQQLEIRVALGQGKPGSDTLVFSDVEGNPRAPNDLSRDWRRFILSRKLPPVSFHGLRHSHVSALTDRGVDVVTISKRIGHANPATTLRIYAHMFRQTDTVAADAIEAALREREK